MLTRKQHELLSYIKRRLDEDGVSPSFDEMKEALNLRSKSGIHRLISALEERGFIRRLPHRARALEVLRGPEASGEAGRSAPAAGRGARDLVDVPLLGRIAAGRPIEAISDPNRTVSLPAGMLGRGPHYALEVRGDSMIGEGILDGDIAVIQETSTATANDIVVALVEREEATLKRIRWEGDSVLLEAANPAFPTQRYGAAQVQVQGRLVALFRRY